MEKVWHDQRTTTPEVLDELIQRFFMKSLEIGAIYRHYKGPKVRVLFEAVHTETGEPLVIYLHLEDGAIWARPKKMFLETIKVKAKKVERFKKIIQKVLIKPNNPK